jgi:hypothetical protein
VVLIVTFEQLTLPALDSVNGVAKKDLQTVATALGLDFKDTKVQTEMIK